MATRERARERVKGRCIGIARMRKGGRERERERERERWGQVPGCESFAPVIFPSRILANEKSTK